MNDFDDIVKRFHDEWKAIQRGGLSRSEVNEISDRVQNLKGYGHVMFTDERDQFVIDAMASMIQWRCCSKLIEAFDREK